MLARFRPIASCTRLRALSASCRPVVPACRSVRQIHCVPGAAAQAKLKGRLGSLPSSSSSSSVLRHRLPSFAVLGGVRFKKTTTGLAGVPVIENAREVLIDLYSQILREVRDKIPHDHAYYRQTTNMYKHYLTICLEYEDIEDIENEICYAQAEELIEMAERELIAVELMAERVLRPDPYPNYDTPIGVMIDANTPGAQLYDLDDDASFEEHLQLFNKKRPIPDDFNFELFDPLGIIKDQWLKQKADAAAAAAAAAAATGTGAATPAAGASAAAAAAPPAAGASGAAGTGAAKPAA